MAFRKATSLEALKKAEKMTVELDGKIVLLLYYNEQVYAINNLCPHQKASLYDGTFEDGVLTCPKHGAKIDVKKGKILEKPKVLFFKVPVKRASHYPTQIDNGDIYVAI